MESKLLSAEQWLEKEEISPINYPQLLVLMERYANYKSKELQALILGFMNELDKVDCSAGGSIGIDGEFIKPYYVKYFNINS